MNTTRLRDFPTCLKPYKRQLYPSLKDFCLLQFNPPFLQNLNQLGGTAYIERYSQIPKDSAGKTMQLLAQIDFSTFQLDAPFPQEGLLQIFVNADFGKMNTPIEHEQFQIKYTQYIDHSIKSEALEIVESNITLPVYFSPTIHCEYISAFDYRLSQYVSKLDLFIEDEARTFLEIYSDYMLGADHKIGGYPYFLENDFRSGRPDLQIYDTLLFQLVSDDTIGFNYRDCGIVSFFMNSEQLANKDFSNIYMHVETY